MPKLNTLPGYYDPLKFILKKNPKDILENKQQLIDNLNSAYRHALRKILFAYPASFEQESPLYSLCVDFILNTNDITEVTEKWIDDQINKNEELFKLKNLSDKYPDGEKLQLIKAVTAAHQKNLTSNEDIFSFVNNTLVLEGILNKEYKHGMFSFYQKSISEINAVTALKEALREKPADLLPHLSTLRKCHLSGDIRSFVKQGHADKLLKDQSVRTIKEFVSALHGQVNSYPHITVSLS